MICVDCRRIRYYCPTKSCDFKRIKFYYKKEYYHLGCCNENVEKVSCKGDRFPVLYCDCKTCKIYTGKHFI